MAKRPDPALLARGKPSNSQTPAKEPAGNPANKSHFIPPSAQQSPVQHDTSPEALPISHVDTSVSLVDSTVILGLGLRETISNAIRFGSSNLSVIDKGINPSTSDAKVLASVGETHEPSVILSLLASESNSGSIVFASTSITAPELSIDDASTASVTEDGVGMRLETTSVMGLQASDSTGYSLNHGNTSLSVSNADISEYAFNCYIYRDNKFLFVFDSVLGLKVADSSISSLLLGNTSAPVVSADINKRVTGTIFEEDADVLKADSILGISLSDSQSYSLKLGSSSLPIVDASVDESLSAVVTEGGSVLELNVNSILGLSLVESLTADINHGNVVVPTLEANIGEFTNNTTVIEDEGDHKLVVDNVVLGLSVDESAQSDSLVLGSSSLPIVWSRVSNWILDAEIREGAGGSAYHIMDNVLGLSAFDGILETEVHEMKQGSNFIYWDNSPMTTAEFLSLSAAHDSVIRLKSRPYPYVLEDITLSSIRGRVDYMLTAKGYDSTGLTSYTQWDDNIAYIEVIYLPLDIESPPLILGIRRDVYDVNYSLNYGSTSLAEVSNRVDVFNPSVIAEVKEGEGIQQRFTKILGLNVIESQSDSAKYGSSISAIVNADTDSSTSATVEEGGSAATHTTVVVVGKSVSENVSHSLDHGNSTTSQVSNFVEDEAVSLIKEDTSVSTSEATSILSLSATESQSASLIKGQSSVSFVESQVADSSIGTVQQGKISALHYADSVIKMSASDSLSVSDTSGSTSLVAVDGTVTDSSTGSVDESILNAYREIYYDSVLSIRVTDHELDPHPERYILPLPMPVNLSLDVDAGSSIVPVVGSLIYDELDSQKNYFMEDAMMSYVPEPPVDTTPPPVFVEVPPVEAITPPPPQPVFVSKSADISFKLSFKSILLFSEFGQVDDLAIRDLDGTSSEPRSVAKSILDLLLSNRPHNGNYRPYMARLMDESMEAQGSGIDEYDAAMGTNGSMYLRMYTTADGPVQGARHGRAQASWSGVRRVTLPEIDHFKAGRIYLPNGTSFFGVSFGNHYLHPLERDSLGGWGVHYQADLEMTSSTSVSLDDAYDEDLGLVRAERSGRLDISNHLANSMASVLNNTVYQSQYKALPNYLFMYKDKDRTQVVKQTSISFSGGSGNYGTRIYVETDRVPALWSLGYMSGNTYEEWSIGAFATAGDPEINEFIFSINMFA